MNAGARIRSVRRVRPAALLSAALLLGACAATRAPDPAAARRPPGFRPSAPAAVRPFPSGRPDVVLLVTGGGDGRMEVCDCPTIQGGGLARRSGLAASYRAAFDPVVLADLGDALWVEPRHPRNRFVYRAYRLLGYDVAALGDQEWALPADLAGEAFPPGPPTYLATNVSSSTGPKTARAVRVRVGGAVLGLVSYVDPEAFAFTDAERVGELDIRPVEAVAAEAEALRRDGAAVVLIYHGQDEALESVVSRVRPGLVLRGHVGDRPRPMTRAGGAPVIPAGGAETVWAVGMNVRDGRIVDVHARLETVDDRWPADERMVELYRASGAAERKARAEAGTGGAD